jgi:hypothetical protein
MFTPAQPLSAGNGSVGGHTATCETCGLVLRSSLSSSLVVDMLRHEQYHAKKETGRK